MSNSPAHSCGVQWDCWLIAVQPYSQYESHLLTKGTHRNSWLRWKGRALFPSLWNSACSLPPISLCVFPNSIKSCQQKLWRGSTEFYPIMNWKVCLGVLETSCSQADSLIPLLFLHTLLCLHGPPMARDACQQFGAETQILALARRLRYPFQQLPPTEACLLC